MGFIDTLPEHTKKHSKVMLLTGLNGGLTFGGLLMFLHDVQSTPPMNFFVCTKKKFHGTFNSLFKA